jgi:hypothetical protein
MTGMSRLYEEVHIIAMRYHWSEAEILRLPKRKRSIYLDIIARQFAAET